MPKTYQQLRQYNMAINYKTDWMNEHLKIKNISNNKTSQPSPIIIQKQLNENQKEYSLQHTKQLKMQS
jgi:hypothetical protein